MFKTICQQEAVGRDTQGGVMMKSTPAPSLVVAQAELLLELLIVPFNAPAHLSDLDQFHQRRVLGQRRQPILRRFGLPGWPFDQQPLLLTQSAAPLVTMRRPHAHGGEARRQDRVGALAPLYRAPSARFQGLRQRLHADRASVRAALQPRRWTPDSVARLWGAKSRAR